MPMQWNAEADSKLLVGILQVFDLKFSKEVMDKLNAHMGPECSGQSISSRLAKLKKAVGAKSDSAPVTPKTPRSTQASKRKKFSEGHVSGDDEESPVKKKGLKTPKALTSKTDSVEDDEATEFGANIKQKSSFFDNEDYAVESDTDAV